MAATQARRSRRPRRSPQPVPVTARAVRKFEHAYAPIDVFTADEEESVHQYSLRILENTGLKFLSPETWSVLEQAGCRVDRDTGITRFHPT